MEQYLRAQHNIEIFSEAKLKIVDTNTGQEINPENATGIVVEY